MRYLRILGFVAAFAIVFVIARQAYLFFGKGTLSVNAKPADASIVIDKNAYTTKQAQDVQLSPGEHRVIVALDGFNTIEQTITMGWQDSQSFTYQLTPKSFKDIYQNLSSDITFTDYEAVNPRFYLDNTWAAAYIVNNDEEGDVSIAVIRRTNGAWRLVLHSHELTDETKSTLPPVVSDYFKGFQQ